MFNLLPPIIFDTDCLSSFLWIRRFDILRNLFKDNIVVPGLVLDELSNLRRFSHHRWVPDMLQEYVARGEITLTEMASLSVVADEYARLTNIDSLRPMGAGEAAVLALVRFEGGTVASNNLTDIRRYCDEHALELISSDDILCLAVERGMVTENEGVTIWEDMIAHKQKLPSYGFVEALRRFRYNLRK